MKNYPFVKCLHPTKVYNKHSEEYIIASCGHCESCNMIKSQQNSLKCQLESACHVITMFITLTYNNENVPRAVLIKDDTTGNHLLVETTDRLLYGEILNEVTTSEYRLDKLKEKFNIDGDIPHLSKRDVQLFLKRLRKHVTTEKIRYFVAGEYGPLHYRPHYHLMLWFEKQETLSFIQQNINKIWTFGNIDAQVSFNKCSSYVASYVNSNCYLPQLLKSSQVKPFCCHSRFLGEKILRSKREEIYKSSYSQIINQVVPLDGDYRNVVLWRTLKTYYFPRCKNYSSLDTYQRMHWYQLYLRAKEITGLSTPSEQSQMILSILAYNYTPKISSARFYDFIFDNIVTPYLNNYFENIYKRFVKNGSSMSVLYNVMTNRQYHNDKYLSFGILLRRLTQHQFNELKFGLCQCIANSLRMSYHFIEFLCQGSTDYNIHYQWLKKIEQFYEEEQNHRLHNQLIEQEENLYDWFSTDNYEDYYYSNIFDAKEYIMSKSYQTFSSQVKQDYSKFMKHKEQNDVNAIFDENYYPDGYYHAYILNS